MSSSAVLGQYLWHELLTTDPDAGAGFYSKVLGWNKVPYEGDAGYTMLGNAQGPVGGARVVGKDPLADKAGPSWLTYVGVPDLPAALAAVEAKGGRVLHPMTAVPGDGGRYAVIVDPQGATIGVYEPAGMADGAAAAAGSVVWHELTAANPEAALQFYNAIFGWEVVATHEMGGDVGTYYLFGQGATQKGGAYAKRSAGSGSRWLVYLAVPSVTAAVAAAKAAGGTVLNPPHQVPGGSWIAQLLDSHGVALAVHGPMDAAGTAPKASAQPVSKAKAKVKTKVKAAPVKSKARTPSKPKPKPKTKAKSKTAAKRKVAAKSKVKTKVKRAAKAKPKVKAKSKGKAKAKAKTKAPRGRKQARRGK